MVKDKINMFFKATVNAVKEFIQNPVNFVYIVIGVIIAVIIILSAGVSEVEEYVKENLTERIELDSDGCGNVYVRDGIILSFETVYYENNFIALQVELTNNTQKNITVTAEIKQLDESISFTSDKSQKEYLIIGDSQYSNYDVEISLSQEERVLADGVVHVTHSAENGMVFQEKTTVYLGKEMEIYYLGNHEENQFMIFNNKTPMDLNVTFLNDEGGFSLTAPKNTYKYTYISNIGAVSVNINTYEITFKEVSAEDIEIEKVDGTEQEGGF